MMPPAYAVGGINIFVCGGFYQNESKGIASLSGFGGLAAYGGTTNYARDDGQI
ncbi:MAG: hypothetical protein ACRDAP_12345 [Shewanella sp.]